MLIFSELDLSSDTTSEIIKIEQLGARPAGLSLYFQWYTVTGTLDGTFEVFAYSENDIVPLKPFIAGFDSNKVTITTADNTTNCSMIVIPFPIQKILIKYVRNGVTGGVANVNLTQDFK